MPRPRAPQGAQERRLAGAVRAEQRDHLARREREPDAVEHRSAAVADGEVADLERAAVREGFGARRRGRGLGPRVALCIGRGALLRWAGD